MTKHRFHLPTAALATIAFAIVLGASWIAAADNVDTLITQLQTGSDYKVRLAAALGLTTQQDARGIPALIKALADDDKNVRAAAAVGLGKLITEKSDPAVRAKAIEALTSSAQGDSSDFVRKQADKAAEVLRKLGGGGSSITPTSGKIFVDIGPMSAKTEGNNDKLRDVMHKTTEKTFGKAAKDMMTTWPGGKSPTKPQLTSQGITGYHVDGTLTDLTTKTSGASTIVSCKVSMLIATYPEKSMFAFLNGGASVQATSSPSEIAFATEDCVTAVMEDLIAKKVVPTLKTRSGQ